MWEAEWENLCGVGIETQTHWLWLCIWTKILTFQKHTIGPQNIYDAQISMGINDCHLLFFLYET